ncbi:dipeptide epimerase [Cloacibacillus porcorum]|uniref:dipeptide epimerase n=1 Tax=Cloacibacillus porcorum TaxID=1197717 RepID=UPI001459207C|nr:dipeptide epimerase [Cloacibacillus porcorum]MCC8183492.1 dipeptide epimerase [Cloacibacillus porcorum]MCI5865130.1 dipeptide epimerase [Cloacibacillus porcorum]MDY5389607.1 dipeptide epimerase [Cloacibacillus porcorum]NMF17752.1 dipeptide epimerase [Cloacibacillus porcorum]
MKIKSINTGLLLSPLKTPFITAVRSVDVLTDVIVRIETDTGLVGWGAAAPTAKVTGETVGSITGAVNEVIAPQLLESDCGYLEGNLDLLDGALLHNTSAKAAVDIALHDIWGKSVGQPVWKLFGGNGKSIVSDVTISLNSPEVMAADTVAAVERGFSIVKIKVGGEVSLDFERLKTIFNAVGSNVKVRLDANQGWKPNEAVKILCEMETSGFAIELVEQPVKSFDMDGLRFVTAHSPFPVMADESCQSVKDAIDIIKTHAADMINIKLMKCGGIRGALRIISVAQAFGVKVMVGAMLEGKVSAAAAAHIASSFSCVSSVDLDGPNLCSEHLVSGGPVFTDGPEIHMNDNAGFGITDVPGVIWN